MDDNQVPMLRDDVMLVPQDNPDFPYVLVDKRIGQRIKLEVVGFEVASLLDREQTLGELKQRVIDEEIAIDPELVHKIIAFFGNYHLLDDQRTDEFLRARNDQKQTAYHKQPLLFLDDEDRFSCVMCGSCCGGHNVGPVSKEVLAKVQPHREELLQLTKSKRGLFFSFDLEDNDQQMVVTMMRNGFCVFLDQKNACILHGKYGPDHKPLVCNIFPLHFVETPDGIAVSYQMECRSYIASKHAAKTPLREQEAQFRAWLEKAPTIPKLRPIIPLDPMFSLEFGDYREFEQDVLSCIKENRADIRKAMLSVGSLLEDKRLSKGAKPRVAKYVESDLGKFQDELFAFRDQFAGNLRGLYEKYAAMQEGARPSTKSLDLVLRVLDDLERYMTMALQYRKNRDVAEMWFDTYRHYFWSKDITQRKGLMYGQALFGLRYVLSHALATQRANDVARRHVTEQDVYDSIVVTSYLLRNKAIQSVLSEFDDEIVAIFGEQLHMFFEFGSQIAPEPTDLEFFIF